MSGLCRIGRPLMLPAALLIACLVGLRPEAALAKYASLVADADSGRILHSVNADTRNYPASLTKMMTLYMVFDALDRGRITPGTKLRVSSRAAKQPPSKLGLRTGQTITVENAILALVTKSANDVAVVVAEGLGGSEARFARMMTERARALGMTRTTFKNASGLPNKGQLSTARDMALLAIALLRHFPHHYRKFSTKTFAYKGQRYRNHNRLLGTYPGVDGIKTGYIRASGFNLVASARRNGRRLVGVVFGGKSSASRNAHMTDLLDDGFKKVHATQAVYGGEHRGSTVGAHIARRPQENAQGSSWGVQVGAFRTHRAASTTARRAAQTLAPSMPNVVATVVRSPRGTGTTSSLSRLISGTRASAYEACRVLTAERMRCLVLRLNSVTNAAAARVNPALISPPTAKPVAAWDGGPAAGGTGEFGIQVGAFPAPSEAQRTAEMAILMAPAPLGGGEIEVQPVEQGSDSPLYRARVIGISKQEAEDACRHLRGEDVQCLVLGN